MPHWGRAGRTLMRSAICPAAVQRFLERQIGHVLPGEIPGRGPNATRGIQCGVPFGVPLGHPLAFRRGSPFGVPLGRPRSFPIGSVRSVQFFEFTPAVALRALQVEAGPHGAHQGIGWILVITRRAGLHPPGSIRIRLPGAGLLKLRPPQRLAIDLIQFLQPFESGAARRAGGQMPLGTGTVLAGEFLVD